MKIHVPPIKCQGIKTKLVDWIKEYVELSPTGYWIEPFAGSGVVGFNIRPQRAIFADINPHIINFYNAIKSGALTAAEAKAFLEEEGALLSRKGKDHYYEIRERFNKDENSLDFLFLNRSCFNGVMRFNKKGLYNVPFGHKPDRFAQAYITKIVNQIKYVEDATSQYDWSFVCSDFRKLIKSATDKDFLYCDPPYAGRHTDYFNAWSDKEEQELFDLLLTTPAKFILSTWHSNKYRQNMLLERHSDRFLVLTKEHFYHVGASENYRNAMLEAIVLNYSPTRLGQQDYVKTEPQATQLRLLEEGGSYVRD